ncbi:heavy metal translocating P-type ATPase [Methanospirillum stamsii]|uniref:Heavy metal translocating P-type ATPase n=1 Tax=Methanospirillum stamsii TaxID=1277351 RepID=A0A2V2MWN5_9EURY|nr:heavy metal translocating P-type ATPase [Methanospirillum stamsii]PWR71799.1 heavy metal translocating P-type ATPase [Methanospirillum stamsii]
MIFWRDYLPTKKHFTIGEVVTLEERVKKIELQVDGMHCATCALTVEKGLSSTPGVTESKVNLSTGKATIEYDPSLVTLSDLTTAVEKSGFSVAHEKISVRVGGMACASCVQSLTKFLLRQEGIISVDVNLSLERANITYNPSLVNIHQISEIITRAGFKFLGTDSSISKKQEDEKSRQLNHQLYKVIFGFALSLILMAMMYFTSFDMQMIAYLQLIITTPVLIMLAYPIFKAAIGALRTLSLTMDVMYAMGIGVAYLASVLGTFSIILENDALFYETTLMLASFLMLGRFLEAKAKGKTSSAIKALMSLEADTATIIRDDNEFTIPVQEVKVGDIIRVRPGSRIPVDGIVVSGSSYVDESMVTGEPLAVHRVPEQEVIGGTLVTTGSFVYRATRVGADTMLARIIRLVEEAQGSRPPVQRLADKAVSWFIPVVLTIAIISSLYWYGIRGMDLRFSLQTFIAVLVVACPCALGLATPTAVTVGIGRGAEHGILIRNGSVLEIANKISLALFDKTGTITNGKPVVTNIDSFTGNPDLLLSMAASLEFLSEHPISGAVLRAADEKGIEPAEVTGFENISGSGLTGVIAGSRVHLGTRDFVSLTGVSYTPEQESIITRREKEGKTIVLISRDGFLLGLISISDEIKSDAGLCVRLLREMGIECGMVTGDNQVTAESVAAMVDIHKVYSRILPEGKEKKVDEVQRSGEIVAFIGDGINDAPALARADTGIAIGSGTDVAIESADIVLVRDSLVHIVAAIQLAKKVMGRIKLNLFWAFFYNSILIPLAAGVLYPVLVFRPEYGAFAMAFSSVTVVSLSLLLKSYTPPALLHLRNNESVKKEKDLVCGMMVDTTTAQYWSDIGEKRYYFCNKGCKEAFDANPDSFIEK